jgi:hypothetical protein
VLIETNLPSGFPDKTGLVVKLNCGCFLPDNGPESKALVARSNCRHNHFSAFGRIENHASAWAGVTSSR